MSATLPDKTFAIFSTDANKKLIAELKTRGAVFDLPPVSAVKTEVYADEIDPFDFDWLVFSDVFAADFFLERLAAQEFDLYELDAVRICAFGEAVADRLRFVQVHADVIPQKNETETIFNALRDYISSAADLAGLRFLIVGEASAENELTERLRRANAAVRELPLYKFAAASLENPTKLKTLLKGGAADEFIFSSPFDVTAVRFLFGEKLPDLLKETQISATDEITFQTLLENGLRPLYFRK